MKRSVKRLLSTLVALGVCLSLHLSARPIEASGWVCKICAARCPVDVDQTCVNSCDRRPGWHGHCVEPEEFCWYLPATVVEIQCHFIPSMS